MFNRLALFVGLFFLAAINAFTQTGDSSETIRVDTRLVSVPVIVSDRNGRYIPNLTQRDFSVFQDGMQQKIDFFAATEEPLTIALLIDTSQSTRPVLDDIKDSARSLVKLLTPRDRAMIVSFDYDTHILSQLTADQEQLRKAIRNAEIPDRQFGTTLRDAAFQTVNRSFAGIKGRKAIIILTDGKDVGSQVTGQELLYSLQETDTLIYTIMFTTGNQPGGGGQLRLPGGRRDGGIFGGRFPMPRNRRDNPKRTARVERANEEAEEFLQDLSETTAGRFYTSKDGRIKKTFEMIVEELRFQYRIGFYPPEESLEKIDENIVHELKVRVSRPETVVRARTKYRLQTK